MSVANSKRHVAHILAHSLYWPAFVGDGDDFLPIFGLTTDLLLQLASSLEYVVCRTVKRLHSSAFGNKLLPVSMFFQNLVFVVFAVMMDMALFAQAKSTEGKALLQTLHLHPMTEVRERASIRIGGENEGDEVDRVGGSELGPSSAFSTSRM